jgi:dethiobiotin synthetase
VKAWGEQKATAGLKPVETGGTSDVLELGRASTFHVTRFTSPYLLTDPVSPHLAARREGRTIELPVIGAWVDRIRSQAEAVVLELAGGLFTPLGDAITNADLVRFLHPSRVVLVASDRLGALHDVLTTMRAARSDGVAIDAVVLSAPEQPDLSTGTNAAELGRMLATPKQILTLPRTEDARAVRTTLAGVLEGLC